MPQRRWYGAVLLAAAVVIGTVYGRRPDAVVHQGPPTPVERENLQPPIRPGAQTELPTIQPAGHLPDPAPVPSESEAAANKWAAAAAPALTAVVRPPLVVTQAAPETARRGETVPIEIRVTNNTAEPLQHVVLRAQIPPGLQFLQGNVVEAEVGTLAAKETRSVHLDAQAIQVGRAVNEVTARAAGGLSARSETTVLVQEAGLVVNLEGSRQATVGAEMNLRVEVTNGGSKPARGVGLLLTLPDGIEPLSASTGGTVDPTNHAVVGWALGVLAAGERQAVTLKAKARVAGDGVCQATVRAVDLADTKTTATLHVEAAPALGLEIGGRDDAIDTGAETVYEMRVLNPGGVPCPGVRLAALVPDGLKVVHAEGPTAAVIHQQRVQFDPLPDLPGRTEALYHLRLRGEHAGDWCVRVRVEADPLENPILREVHLRVNATDRGGSGP